MLIFTICRSFLRENAVLAGDCRSRECPRPSPSQEPLRASRVTEATPNLTPSLGPRPGYRCRAGGGCGDKGEQGPREDEDGGGGRTELGPSTKGLVVVSSGLAVVALRWHWVPGQGCSRRVFLGVTLSCRVPQHPRGPARPRTLPWGRGVPVGSFLVPSNGHRPGDIGEDRHCVSFAALCRPQRSPGRILPRAPNLNSTQAKRDRGLFPLTGPALEALSLPGENEGLGTGRTSRPCRNARVGEGGVPG